MGAVLAAGFFWFIKAFAYETANPGQDFDDLEANVYNPEEEFKRPSISQGDPTLRALSNAAENRPDGPSLEPDETVDLRNSTHVQTTVTS